jgi:hypothetical protein
MKSSLFRKTSKFIIQVLFSTKLQKKNKNVIRIFFGMQPAALAKRTKTGGEQGGDGVAAELPEFAWAIVASFLQETSILLTKSMLGLAHLVRRFRIPASENFILHVVTFHPPG